MVTQIYISVYNYNMTDISSDLLSIPYSELVHNSFGTSAPRGNKQVNSTKTNMISTRQIYCDGNVRINGYVEGALKLMNSIHLFDGTVDLPGLSYLNSQNTGFYRTLAGQVGVSVNGVSQILFGPNQVVIDQQITTSTGNLSLNPAGPYIDLNGKTLINAGGSTYIVIGSPNQVIVNNSQGNLISEAQLATVRGGVGLDTSASNGVARVTAGTWSVSPLVDSDFGTINAFTASQITAVGIGGSSGNPLVINTPFAQVTNLGGSAGTYTAGASTNGTTPTNIFTLSTVSGKSYTLRGLITLTEASGDSGSFTFISKVKNVGGVVTASGLVQLGSILDNGIHTAGLSISVSGASANITAVGVVAKYIKWVGQYIIAAQAF